MRRLLWLGACALSMLWAASALADVRYTPPRVQWVGAPPALEPGKPVAGAFRIVTSTPATITNVRLEGAGWSARIVESPPVMSLSAPGRLNMRFQGTAEDFTKPLVVRFEADGVEYAETLDLAAIARQAQPGALKSVPATEDPFRFKGSTFAAPGAEAEEDALALRGKPDRVIAEPAAPSAVSGRNIRVHGRFVYTRSDGVTIGADGVAVRIYDEDTGGDDLLATTVTDVYGYYDVTFFWDPCAVFCESQPDIYVHFASGNSEIDVQSTGGSTYAWASGTTDDYAGSDLDKGWLTPTDEGTHPALHVLTDLTRDWRWYLNKEGYDLPSVIAYWPDGSSGAWYDPGTGDLHFGTDRSWREDSQAHEYGHHFIYTFAVGQTPDYCNGICDSPPDCGHCLWCEETNHDAWNEGWPNWICHVQTMSYETDYGIASLNTRNMENVSTCSGSLDDPTITEGFMGALLQDIWDSTNEDDAGAPGTWMDRFSWGYNEIFTVTDLDHPLNPLDFINKLKNRYPSYKEQIWETAKNCTYEVDAASPSAVTNLTSPSHAVGSSSPDPTVQFTWTRAADDWSGPSGYSITVQATASLPDATQDITDVTTWTSGVLAPGTYRFNIRTRDRSGKWSGSYATYGPFTIREAEPANLTYVTAAGWAAPIVPRATNDATVGSVPAPTALLPGNASGTYWNVRGVNDGESSTSVGFQTRLMVDDVYTAGYSWGAVGAGVHFAGINGGPLTIRGGRHTFAAAYDATDAIAETSESDNDWGRQWIWMPLTLTPDTDVNRSAPPLATAGWPSIVDGAGKWFNTDGLRFATNLSGKWWHAVYVYATNLEQDYDCRLHFATSAPDTGFTTNHGYSGRAAGWLDAVLVNRNRVSSPASWDVGVLNQYEGTSGYVARQVTSVLLSFGDSVNVVLDTGDMMLLREYYLGVADTGWVSVTARIVSGSGPLYLQWRDQDFSLGDLSDYSSQVTVNGTTTSRISAYITTTGYQGLCLYRNPLDGDDSVTVVLEIEATPPDYVAYSAPGWYSAFVPRPAYDGTPASVPDPDTLHGNTASTYFNWCLRNASPVPSPGLSSSITIDGVASVGAGYGPLTPYYIHYWNWASARTVRGGRHTLAIVHDHLGLVEELSETNNGYGQQYVWSPYVLTMNTPLSRTAPPDRSGGWDLITSGAYWYNADGLRIPGTGPSGGNNYWQAVAVMPGAASDVDVRMHDLVPGAHDGFGTNHGSSAWGTGKSDYCLVDLNTISAAPRDIGVLGVAGTQSYTAEWVGSSYRGSYPNAIYGPYTLAANRILHLHEFFLAAGTYAVDVFNESGTVNWGLTVHPRATAFQVKSTAVTGGVAWLNGPGQPELATVTIPGNGYYCVAVWKSGAADLPLSGTYRLQVRPLVTDVPGGAPARTALAAAFPNPLHDGTNVAFDLAAAGNVRLEVYDLHGARVRTLTNRRWEAGTWQVRWNGDDESGRGVAPGVYFVRFQAHGVTDARRVVKTN